MPMPNKTTTDGLYRYAFQGQEKDPETGMEAFELRLWDGRLGSWLTVDPMGQYDSPYSGMGNNPISRVDPDRGTDGPGDGIPEILRGPPEFGPQNSIFANPIQLEGVTLINTHHHKQNYNTTTSFKGDFAGLLNFNKSWEKTTSKTQIVKNDFSNFEALIASSYEGDQTPYSISDQHGTIDCSRFTREVALKAGYKIPRNAFQQAKWYQRYGIWSDKLSDAQAGDHIFWERGINACHTGIVLKVSAGNIIIKVIQAQTFNHKPGSIHIQQLTKNGQMRGFGQPFVGVGRKK